MKALKLTVLSWVLATVAMAADAQPEFLERGEVVAQEIGVAAETIRVRDPEWQKYLQEGVIVSLHVNRWRAKKALTLEDLGIAASTPEEKAAWNKVINLGIKQPISAILEAARKHQVHAIGMSGLLVKSTVVMRENLEEMNRQQVSLPVILGGAALSRRYVEEDCRAVYRGRVDYGRDAFEGLRLMEEIRRGPVKEAEARGAELLEAPEVKTPRRVEREPSGARRLVEVGAPAPDFRS